MVWWEGVLVFLAGAVYGQVGQIIIFLLLQMSEEYIFCVFFQKEFFCMFSILFVSLEGNWLATAITGTIASKINGTPKSVYLPISKLHSILTVANLLAHNNISQICYCGQISFQSAAVNCIFSDNLTSLGVTFILLVLVR